MLSELCTGLLMLSGFGLGGKEKVYQQKCYGAPKEPSGELDVLPSILCPAVFCGLHVFGFATLYNTPRSFSRV